MIQLDRARTRRTTVDRRADRLVAMTSIALALGFLCAAVLASFLPAGDRAGPWLPLHLAMAGAASTAIAGVMPFFSAAIATTQPVAAALRWASLLAVVIGAIGISASYISGEPALAALAGLLYIAGIALVGVATLAPMRRALGPKGGVVTLGYAAALSYVGVGALGATLFLAGAPAIVASWAWLKPAHAWLNLVGFVSLAIATTLLHFLPTVIGARIRRTASAYLTVAGLALGALLVALGFSLRGDLLARAGAVLTLAGSVSLAVYGWQAWRSRARWSGDAGWHRFASVGLISAMAWFELGILLAAARLLAVGADPAQPSTDVLVGPLAAGWMGLAVVASATHLVPAIGPGEPAEHARQRQLLGRWAWPRLVAADAGIAALVVGYPLGAHYLAVAGMMALALALLSTAALIAAAIVSGIGDARRSGLLGP